MPPPVEGVGRRGAQEVYERVEVALALPQAAVPATLGIEPKTQKAQNAAANVAVRSWVRSRWRIASVRRAPARRRARRPRAATPRGGGGAAARGRAGWPRTCLAPSPASPDR
eukprot:5462654-Prymnesium_polylepis.1